MNSDVSFISFSKDRPAQLDLMIRSLVDNFQGFSPESLQVVLSTPKTKLMAETYEMVFRRFPGVTCYLENSPAEFKPGVKHTLSRVGTPFLLFVMDDDVVSNPVYAGPALRNQFTKETCALTLRLGKDSNYSYTERRGFQWKTLKVHDLQDGQSEASRLMEWDWKSEASEPGYPCCINFNVYPTEWFKWLEPKLEYRGPNSFEGWMSHERHLFPSRMLAFAEPKIIEIPVNKVQTENANEAGKSHPADTVTLAQKYFDGQQISTSNLYGVHHNSPHIELPFIWEPRQ